MSNMPSGGNNSRLERIEKKIDDLSAVVVSLAKIEERMITLFKRIDTYDTKQAEQEKRLTSIEKTLVGRGFFFQIVDKAAWIVVASVITLYITR